VSNFADAVEYILEREGGLSENPRDSGGATNFGISLRFLRGFSEEVLRKYGIFGEVNEQTIRDLTKEQAQNIYKSEFWQQAPFSEIRDQLVCNYVFDMAVNMGTRQAVQIVQRSLWALMFSRLYIADDGILGERTLERLNIMVPDLVMPVLVASRAAFYRLLAEKNPNKREFLNGWLTRCYRI